MKVVLDTNVVVSAFALEGRMSRLRVPVASGRLTFVVCEGLVAEYLEVLSRRKLGLGDSAAQALVRNTILLRAEVREPKIVEPVCRDADDDVWVALAREAGVPLVTGDGDILALRGKVEGLEVWTAAELVAKLAA